MTRDELIAHLKGFAYVLTVIAAAVLTGVLAGTFLSGCGPRAVTIQHSYVATKDRCVDDARRLLAECPSGAPCVQRLNHLRAVCDAEMASICNQSRRARKVCGQ